MSYVAIIVTFVLINNFVLTYFLGLCPMLGASRRPGSSLGMGLAATFIMSLSALVTWALRTWLLAPLGIGFLQTFVFVIVIAALGYYVELLIESVAPSLHRLVGSYLPLITTNCIVVGIAFVASRSEFNAAESLIAGASAGFGFLLVLVIVSSIRERLETEWVPASFRGIPIAFVTTGLVALAFLAFDQAFLQNLVN
ncbi:MAG TPA: Rnf-Nqr domain containing protein [Spirochaetia bacterium]|nr:Rnf-Nqr domain containing protein [Spirochaetia bacterium]